MIINFIKKFKKYRVGSALLLLSFIGMNLVTSCDKVNNPYPVQYVDVDTTLLSGITLKEYKNTLWTDFVQNSNTVRNVLIEDYTGHKCVNCPNAAKKAHEIELAHQNRVFVASIHAGPNGSVGFQGVSGTVFSRDFTNPNGLEISKILTDGGFVGNPSGTISRTSHGGQIFQNYSSWDSYTSSILSQNSLNVNLQAIANYFPVTRGLFLHTEIDVKVATTNELFQVVYLIEDSLVAPQSTPQDWSVPSLDKYYVHHDIHRGCLDGLAMGKKLTATSKKDKNGKEVVGDKYYLNYSYKLPESYNPVNMHLLIFVYNKSTNEIYQVIKKEL